MGAGSPSPAEEPRTALSNSGLSANQSEQWKRHFPSRNRAFLSIRGRWNPLPLSRRSGDLEGESRQGWRLHFLISCRWMGSPVAGVPASRTRLQHPHPGGGLLKGQCRRQAMSAPSDLPRWGCGIAPLLLCVSGRSLGGTPSWEVSREVE